MGSLADFIEQYLRNILIQNKIIELQRRELAKMFRCAPSQINYVLETRFNLEHGYIVESKRGGGGYIRITPVSWRIESLPVLINELVPAEIGENEVVHLLERLVETNMIGVESAQLLLKLMVDVFADLEVTHADFLRAKFLKAMLMVLGSKSET
ncbi:MAG TPA: CtsR family transcriptional regulator [Firmicutes bacterium]|jgi:transcriptional regulator of stress and heat shock response|nr:CtsR family transcriptional regulator [Bacillota bacterium]